MSDTADAITTALWSETPSANNPFVPETCLCAGFDVYQDVLPKANYIQYLYLLFKREQPNPAQTALLNALSIVLANMGPRDYSVQAAMSGAAGGSTQASSLMAALAVGAGNFGGAREVLHAMNMWRALQQDLNGWQQNLERQARQIDDFDGGILENADDVWLPLEHAAGFDPRSTSASAPVKQSLEHLASLSPGPCLPWLLQNYSTLEKSAGCGLGFSGLAAAAMMDLEFDGETGEMLFLLLRLPGAAAHALEQRERGWRNFPFYGDKVHVTNDPLNKSE